jgi:prefoldin beta subunit
MPTQEDIMAFEDYRNQLMLVTNQKQNIDFQIKTMELALEELGKTREEKVFKAIGNILISSNKDDVEKEIKEQKEELEIRFRSLENQEKKLLEKIDSLRMKLSEKTKEKKEIEK